jgi:hypothetical protein
MAYVATKRINFPAVYRAMRAERKSALEDVGKYVQAKAAQYPARSGESGRSGTLGKSIAVGPAMQPGTGYSWIEVGTNLHYARWVEYGTGIYHESAIGVSDPHDLIRPKNAKALAWRSTGRQMGPGGRRISSGIRYSGGKVKAQPKGDVYMNFAMSVKGIKPWHFMEKAFRSPETEAYFKARVEQMLRNIASSTAGGAG